MSCVNTSLEKFKDTMTRLNVSKESLEAIVYDVQNSLGDDEYFPSDQEILERLHGTSFKASEDQIKLYELKGLSKPMEFGSYTAAVDKVNELRQWFPAEAIRSYKNAKGIYEVHVASPYQSIEQEMQSIKKEAIANGTFMKAPNGNPTNLNERQWLQVRTKNFINWFGDWINNPSEASKVVDENGEPKVVYHGNKFGKKFTIFDKKALGLTYGNDGFFFIDSKEGVLDYVDKNNEASDSIFEVFLNIKTPYNIDYEGYQYHGTGYEISIGDTVLGISNKHYLTKEEEIEFAKKAIRNLMPNDSNAVNNEYFINTMIDQIKITDVPIKKHIDDVTKSVSKETNDGIIANNIVDSSVGAANDYVVFNPNQIEPATSNNGEFSTTNNNIYKQEEDYYNKEEKTPKQRIDKVIDDTKNLHFKNTLYRSQSSIPIIDEQGNLVLKPRYDSLFRNWGLSFATIASDAEDFGTRDSINPYLIEVDTDYLDTVIPLDEEAGTKAENVRAIGDSYSSGGHEQRLQMKQDIIIPKGKFKISRNKNDYSEFNNWQLADMWMRTYAIANSADEIVFSEGYSRLDKGVTSFSDAEDILEELANRLGGVDKAKEFIDIQMYKTPWGVPGAVAPFNNRNYYYERGIDIEEEEIDFEEDNKEIRKQFEEYKKNSPFPFNLDEDLPFQKNYNDSGQQSEPIRTVIDKYIKGDSSQDKLGKVVLDVANKLGVRFVEKNLGEGISGRYVADENTVYINPEEVQENTLIHEAIHAVTSYYLRTKDRSSLPKNIQVAIKEIEECYKLLKQDFIEQHFYENGKLRDGVNVEEAFNFWIQDNDTYGYTSPEEMVAEIGKPAFLEHIRDFDRRHKNDKSLFRRLIDAILSLFSINKEYKSLESTIKEAMMTMFQNPSKELLDKYATELRTIKDNYKELDKVSDNVITLHTTKNLSVELSGIEDLSPGEEMEVYLDEAELDGMFKPEGAKHMFTNPQINTIVQVANDSGRGLLLVTKPGRRYENIERTNFKGGKYMSNGVIITVTPLDYNYLISHNLDIKVNSNNVAYVSNFETQDNKTMQDKQQTREQDTIDNKPKTIEYTPIGKERQTYTIEGNKIFNKNGVEVFASDSKDRRKIFANLAVREGRAVVVDYNSMKYVVNNKGKILSTATGNFVWENTPENGNRKAILEIARQKFGNVSETKEGAKFVNHSGGAKGSDSYWGEVGEKYGVSSNHYYVEGNKTPTGNMSISQDKANEADEHLKKANEKLGRKFPTSNNYVNNLLRRNWQQVSNADAVFAVGHLVKGIVDGGTGWAVQMAIDNGKPVHVFDQERNQWYKNIDGKWSISDVPKLTPNFAGIGTRELNDSGKRAIEEVYAKTFNKQLPPRNFSTQVNNTPKLRANMVFSYGNSKAEGVQSNTTFDAIKEGKRTATTRYVKDGHIDKWKELKVGDIVEFESAKGETLLVRITKPATQLPKDTSAEEWSKKEGWNTDRFYKRVKPEIDKGEAYQIEFEYINPNQSTTQSDDSIDINTPEGRVKASKLLNKDRIQDVFIDSTNHSIPIIYVSSKKGTGLVEITYGKTREKKWTAERMDEPGSYFTKEKQQQIVDTFIPKDLQEYYTSGEYLISQDKSIEEAENLYGRGIENLEKRIYHTLKVSKEGYGKLRDKWGIHFFNQSTGYNSYVPSQSTTQALPSYYEGNITPDNNTIFVFGSNPEGRHGAGAAKIAREQFRAMNGVGEGLTGDSYALPTKDLRVKENRGLRSIPKEAIVESIRKLYETARLMPEKQFKVAYRNTDKASLNGYTGFEMIDMFKEAGQIPSNIVFSKEWVDTGKFNEPTTSQSQEKINIYAGTNENAHLSNFAVRPFTLEGIDLDTPSGREFSVGTVGMANEDYVTFNTVEGAFQAAKLNYLDNISYTTEEFEKLKEKGEDTNSLIMKLSKATGAEARAIGRSLQGLNREAWDKDSLFIMKVLLKESFKQNPDALQQLLETGNAELTHTQDNSKWKTEFPRILMEVREELRKENSREEAPKVEESHTEPAITEEILKQETIIQVKQENKSFMEKAKTIDEQREALDNSELLTPIEIGNTALLVAFWIHDHITALQNEKGKAATVYGEEYKDVDFSNMSRADVVKTIGVGFIMGRAREQYNTENEDIKFADYETELMADEIYDNWDAIIEAAQATLLQIEGFSMVLNKTGDSYSLNEDVNTDEFSDDSNEDSAVLEGGENLQEHWQIESRTRDIVSDMAKPVKAFLMNLLELEPSGVDENGKTKYAPVQDRFGRNKRMKLRKVVNSLVSWGQGSRDIIDLVEMLEKKVNTNPWVSQVIEKLKDNSGNEADFQSQFYSDTFKPFQNYAVVKFDHSKGGYVSIPVNSHPALSEALSAIKAKFDIGQHPMFTLSGINQSSLGKLNDVYSKLAKKDKRALKFDEKEATPEEAKLLEEVSNLLGYAYNLLGYPATPDMVMEALTEKSYSSMLRALKYITNTLNNNKDSEDYNPFDMSKGNREKAIRGNLSTFLSPITDTLENEHVACFFNDGKMYQSYVTPSYLTKMMQKFRNPETVRDFILSEYGESSWFKFPGKDEQGWRTPWLEEFMTDTKNACSIFDHKVQLNFDGSTYMKKMSPQEYTLSLITEFMSSDKTVNGRTTAWYKMPIMSNKPSSEFIRFYSEMGYNYKVEITNKIFKIFVQELSRIQTVRAREGLSADSNIAAIKRFDKIGKSFAFLDYFNAYLNGSKKNTELGKMLNDKIEGKQVDNTKFIQEVKRVIYEETGNKANSILRRWKIDGITSAATTISGITDSNVDTILDKFIWNDTLATMNILQLTVGDIAYYGDAEELQKRLAELHTPGVKGNVLATDYGEYAEDGTQIRKPQRVSDGKFRAVTLTDFESFTSNIIDNINEVFNRKIERAKDETERTVLEELKKSLTAEEIKDSNGEVIQEAGIYRKINVADGQGFSCPTSYRKKAFVFGKWSKEKEAIYQKIRKGEANYVEIKNAMQPDKPVVYSQILKDSGVRNPEGQKGLIETLKVPVYFKNSEYMLVMADAIIQGENTGKPNILRAIFEVMESSHHEEGTDNYKDNGIDTIQFSSAVKSGLSGDISLNDLLENPDGEALAIERLKSKIYNQDGSYNLNVVDEVTFDDYNQQQNIPDHFKDHEQLYSSQTRFITITELSSFYEDGTPVEYNIYGKEGKFSAEEFKREYEETHAANIREAIESLIKDLGLDTFSKKDRNIALAKILRREIQSNARYGIDMAQACSLDENGEFKIPLGDPIQSKRVEQLINSIIKKSVNKQTIAGGPAVLVSSFGTSRKLNIRFKDKNGNLLKTREEYEKKPIKQEMSQIDKFNAKYNRNNKSSEGTLSYEEYIKENQAGIAYYEVFAPIYSKKLLKFADSNGVINIKALEHLDPDLLKLVGSRIPTEDKYSCAPMKIVGFLPREAGDGIMYPYDITAITGEDFDIDKKYVMRMEIFLNELGWDADLSEEENNYIITQKLINRLTKELKEQKGLKGKEVEELREAVERFMDDPLNPHVLEGNFGKKKSLGSANYDALLKWYIQNRFKAIRPTEGRLFRNNKLVDMTYEVLTHETSVDKILNPGNFDLQKKTGYMIAAVKQKLMTWEKAQKTTISELKKAISSKNNLCFIDTQIDFYANNAAAASLLGIFASTRMAHAIIESGSNDQNAIYYINVDKSCGKNGVHIKIGDTLISGRVPIDSRFDRFRNSVGKTFGSLIGASADAAKDPILDLMNINLDTVNVLSTLLRMGVPFETAALFVAQDDIVQLLNKYNTDKMDKPTSIASILKDELEKLDTANKFSRTQVESEAITVEELVEGLNHTNPKHSYKVLNAFKYLLKITESMQLTNFATGGNSITNAVGPLIVNNLMSQYKEMRYDENSAIEDFSGNTITVQDIVYSHPILREFYKARNIADSVFQGMPANSDNFRAILNLCFNNNLGKSFIFNTNNTLTRLSDFYQNCLLLESGVVKSSDAEYYIKDFPREFVTADYSSKYPDNPFVNAIRLVIEKGEPVLKLDTTGMDETEKGLLSNGWKKLHKDNPELSLKLFNYCFFRGGIGFSPKTFMSLLPNSVKTKIPGYIEAYKNPVHLDPERVLDLFVRQNTDEYSLVQSKSSSKKYKFTPKMEDGGLIFSSLTDLDKLKGVAYMFFNVSNKKRLYKLIDESEGEYMVFAEVKPIRNTYTTIEDSLRTYDDAHSEEHIPMRDRTLDEDPETSDTIEDLIYDILIIPGIRNNRNDVDSYLDMMRKQKNKDEKNIKKFLKNRCETLDISYNEELINEIYSKFCK